MHTHSLIYLFPADCQVVSDVQAGMYIASNNCILSAPHVCCTSSYTPYFKFIQYLYSTLCMLFDCNNLHVCVCTMPSTNNQYNNFRQMHLRSLLPPVPMPQTDVSGQNEQKSLNPRSLGRFQGSMSNISQLKLEFIKSLGHTEPVELSESTESSSQESNLSQLELGIVKSLHHTEQVDSSQSMRSQPSTTLKESPQKSVGSVESMKSSRSLNGSTSNQIRIPLLSARADDPMCLQCLSEPDKEQYYRCNKKRYELDLLLCM